MCMKIKPEILTRGGHYISLVNPDVSKLTIGDIAMALAYTCRFGGHTLGFYSVAQHSVLVSHVVPQPFAKAALLHDAAEAIVGDVPAPLKQLLPEFKRIEARIESAYESCIRQFGGSAPAQRPGVAPSRGGSDPTLGESIGNAMQDLVKGVTAGMSGAVCGAVRAACRADFDGAVCQNALAGFH